MSNKITADIPGEAPEVAADEAINSETADIVESAEAEKPLDIPEKFRGEDGSINTEALLASYRELESKQGAGEAPAEPETPPTTDDLQARPSLSDTLATYADEFSKEGTLSEASYAKLLADHNADKAAVDRYIQGEQAIAEQATREIFDIAGGKEEYQQMLAWVKKTEGPEAMESLIERLGANIGTGDRDAIRREMQGVSARYKEGTRTGWAPELTGRDTAGSAIQPFASEAEMREAQMSQAYRDGDEATHKVFDQRLKLSMDMGVL